VCVTVQLWTTGNYHWYLKQSLEFPATPVSPAPGHGCVGSVSAVCWDPERESRLHVVAGGSYLQYTWAWGTDTSPGAGDSHQAITAVIDGSKA